MLFFIIHQYDSSTNVWYKTLSAIEIQLNFYFFYPFFVPDCVLVKGMKMMIGYEKLLLEIP